MDTDTAATAAKTHRLTWKNTVANVEQAISRFLGRCLVVAVAMIATMPLLPSHIRATIEGNVVLTFCFVLSFYMALSLLNWIFLKMVENVEKWVVECREELDKLTKDEPEKADEEWERRFDEYFAAEKATRLQRHLDMLRGKSDDKDEAVNEDEDEDEDAEVKTNRALVDAVFNAALLDARRTLMKRWNTVD